MSYRLTIATRALRRNSPVLVSELPPLFDSLGMALAHAEFMRHLLPTEGLYHSDVIVVDTMGNVARPGDEWFDMVDDATYDRLFPEGFDADAEYVPRANEAAKIWGNRFGIAFKIEV